MKNLTKLFIILFLFLTGCFQKSSSSSNAADTAYEGYYQAIVDNTKFEKSSLYYSMSGEMTMLPDGTYRYYIILDQAQIAMYDVAILAVENNIHYEDAEKMMPNIGIFDSSEFNLIPYQSFSEKGFVKGIVISGECTEEPVNLKILIEWTDKFHQNYNRQFLTYAIDVEHGLYDPTAAEVKPEPTPESTPEPAAEEPATPEETEDTEPEEEVE